MASQNTIHHALPMIAPAQAQKHVTHNEAVVVLDALIDIAVYARDVADPPADPSEGDRYMIASSASGAWAGQGGKLAHFVDGAWAFYGLNPGCRLWVADEALLAVWDGEDWQDIDPAAGAVNPTAFVGVNTIADGTNRLAVKSDAALFSHDDVTPGSGDMRLVVNKASAGGVASFLFQDDWQARAEFGLVGDDDFTLKTSPDGSVFNIALTAGMDSGIVRFPNGVADLGAGAIGGLRNLLVNARGVVNQRGVTGVLAAGAYGPDRWRAGPAGCTVDVADGAWTLDGEFEQAIEDPGLADETVCVSVEDPDHDIAVTLGSQGATIAAGSGRRGVRLLLGSGDTGDLTLRVATSVETTFSNPQVERGLVSTPFEWRPRALELALCQRYFYRFAPTINGGTFLAMKQTTQQWRGVLPVPVPMRGLPTVDYSYAANKMRVYNYAGSFVEVDDVSLVGVLDTGIQLAFETASDMGPSLAILFGLSGNVIDLHTEL